MSKKHKNRKSAIEAAQRLLTTMQVGSVSGPLLSDVETIVEALEWGLRREEAEFIGLLARLTKAVLAGA